MYAVGGCDESNFRLNSVERYNPSTNTWTFTAPMTTCRSSPCVLTCRALYVIGGVSYVGMSLNTGEYLDPVTNTWRPIAPMHDKRASASGAATNGKIYVIGESEDVFYSFFIRPIVKYDFFSIKWLAVFLLPTWIKDTHWLKVILSSILKALGCLTICG